MKIRCMFFQFYKHEFPTNTVHSVIYSQTLFDFKKSISGPIYRVFPRPVLTCIRNIGTCVRKLSGRRPLPLPKGEPAGGSGGMLPRKILKFDVAKTAIFRYFYAFSSAFFLSTVP